MLPQLKKNSAERISQNKDYQLFIKGTPSQLAKAGKGINPDDLQMAEAVINHERYDLPAVPNERK